MASSYSPSLKLELIGNGDQSGTWGTTTNNNLGTLLEQAITGVQGITMVNADYTLTDFNGVSDEARNAVLVATGTNSAIRKIICPLVQKLYVISNQTTGGYAITIGASTGTAITIPNGITAQVYCDGTNFYSSQTGSAGDFTVNGTFTASGNATIGGTLGVTGATSFTVSPTAPTPTAGDSSTKLATTAFVASSTVATATNIAGGAANRIVYQTGVGATGFVVAPTVVGTALVWNGSAFVWTAPSAAVANGCIYENGQTITSDYTMTTGNNGMSSGPITIATGITVTVPTDSNWVIV